MGKETYYLDVFSHTDSVYIRAYKTKDGALRDGNDYDDYEKYGCKDDECEYEEPVIDDSYSLEEDVVNEKVVKETIRNILVDNLAVNVHYELVLCDVDIDNKKVRGIKNFIKEILAEIEK